MWRGPNACLLLTARQSRWDVARISHSVFSSYTPSTPYTVKLLRQISASIAARSVVLTRNINRQRRCLGQLDLIKHWLRRISLSSSLSQTLKTQLLFVLALQPKISLIPQILHTIDWPTSPTDFGFLLISFSVLVARQLAKCRYCFSGVCMCLSVCVCQRKKTEKCWSEIYLTL